MILHVAEAIVLVLSIADVVGPPQPHAIHERFKVCLSLFNPIPDCVLFLLSLLQLVVIIFLLLFHFVAIFVH